MSDVIPHIPDRKAMKKNTDLMLARVVKQLVEVHGVDVDTALTAIMAQCAVQLTERRGALKRYELEKALEKTPVGRKALAQRDAAAKARKAEQTD